MDLDNEAPKIAFSFGIIYISINIILASLVINNYTTHPDNRNFTDKAANALASVTFVLLFVIFLIYILSQKK